MHRAPNRDRTGPDTPPDIRPIPNPTELTTQQLDTAISNLRNVIEVRLNAMDRAVELLDASARKSPTIGESVANFDQQFLGIGQQFRERDIRADQLSEANSTAINAALQAQKEAAAEIQRSSSIPIQKSEKRRARALSNSKSCFRPPSRD